MQTALLQHVTRNGTHYDWLIDAPVVAGLSADRPLWAARVPLPTRDWRTARVLVIDVIQPHRRLYLRYQGPVAGDRGEVVRVDAGDARPVMWTASRLVLDVHMRHYTGRIDLQHLHEHRWRAVMMSARCGQRL